MITRFKIYENKEPYNMDMVRTMMGLKNNQIIKPTELNYTKENNDLYKKIIDYLNWKYKTEDGDIIYFFKNSGANFGVKFLAYDGISRYFTLNDDYSEFINFLNDPEMSKETSKFNL